MWRNTPNLTFLKAAIGQDVKDQDQKTICSEVFSTYTHIQI